MGRHEWKGKTTASTDTTPDWLSAAVSLIDPQLSSWAAFPKQAIAEDLTYDTDELLFGGAAGPGKTEWGIEHCIRQCERHPNNRVVIFRRVFPSLQRTIIPRARMKLAGRATYRDDKHEFTFPNGSVLELAALQYGASVADYQGAEYGCVFFEEVTEFLLSQWEYMLTRLRAPAAGIRAHAFATTNPGGVGHAWVKRRWVKPRPEDYTGDEPPQAYEVWRPVATEDNPEPQTRAFVPATHADNPMLLERDPGYLSRLRGMSNRGLRKAYESGDWDAIDAVAGALWSAIDLDGGRVGWQRRRKAGTLRRVVAIDPSDGITEHEAPGGAKRRGDAFGVSVCAKGLDAVGYVEDAQQWRAPVRKMAEQTIELYKDVRADAIVVEKNHGGAWLVEVLRGVDPYANIKTVWASEGKTSRAEPVAALFVEDLDAVLQFRARMVGEHPDLEEELTSFTGAPGQPSPNMLDAMVWGLSDLMLGLREVRHGTSIQDERSAGRR